LSVKVVGPPDWDAVWRPLDVHESWNQARTFTGSLKVTETLALTATPVAPFAGVVEETEGAASGPRFGVSEKSSIASPSSEPVTSKLFHLIQNVPPLGTAR